MMQQRREYGHISAGKYDAVSLPYGTGRASLYLFLPHLGVRVVDILAELERSPWKTWLAEFRKEDGIVFPPRFFESNGEQTSMEP